ncbi:ATP-binding protein [Actinomadura parmotrematis]|uniref:ATP-binding protein n=1 Tax=Actinomadura parmotrematis TaxID=2864039 RepID=A0ABS7FUZ1_9ACTN|nr:ATP-binding protein [Actinomadura parmotrematis]MBW8484234.1 ATP-binding protein [Actinomadura parmotrematis]
MIQNPHGKPPGAANGVTHLIIKSRPESVKNARDFVGLWFDAQGFDETAAGIAVIVASELVTNAHLHGTGENDDITVRLYRSDAGPMIEVWDGGDDEPKMRHGGIDLESTSGRGLAMIDRIACMWGYDFRVSGGKTVWALLCENYKEPAA